MTLSVRVAALTTAVLLALGLVACSFEAQECCDCMATKKLIGDCMLESYDTCVDMLSRNPPDTDAISQFCYAGSDGFCQESCANILYKN